MNVMIEMIMTMVSILIYVSLGCLGIFIIATTFYEVIPKLISPRNRDIKKSVFSRIASFLRIRAQRKMSVVAQAAYVYAVAFPGNWESWDGTYVRWSGGWESLASYELKHPRFFMIANYKKFVPRYQINHIKVKGWEWKRITRLISAYKKAKKIEEEQAKAKELMNHTLKVVQGRLKEITGESPKLLTATLTKVSLGSLYSMYGKQGEITMKLSQRSQKIRCPTSR